MANIKAAEKAIRTSGRNYERNRALRRRLKTWQKKMDTLVKDGKKKEAAKAMQTFTHLLDKATKRHLQHANKTNRYKSVYQKKVSQIGK